MNAYLIVRDDYSTFTSFGPLWASADATPGGSITAMFTDPGSSATKDYPFDTWSDLVEACNVVVQRYYPPADIAGKPHPRLVQVSYTNPDDTAVSGTEHPLGPPPHDTPPTTPITDPLDRAVIRCDVIAEIDEATIRATATVS